jgi:hypothetical protein
MTHFPGHAVPGRRAVWQSRIWVFVAKMKDQGRFA